jgi:hypothetical protein
MDVSTWFAGLFRRRITPTQLLARYKEILAAILPKCYLTPDGLLRQPSGDGEEVRFEVRSEVPQIRSNRRLAAFVENTVDRALKRHLGLQQEAFGLALAGDIASFATEHFNGNESTSIILSDITDGIFLHEVFHDIQAFFYDHHPDVHESLLKITLDSKREIEDLYASAPRIQLMPGYAAYPEECHWLTGYRPDELFPTAAVCSPYYGLFAPVVERFGWQTLFKIRAVTDAASIEMGHQEIIPTLLTGFACGDTRVTPVLQQIFQSAGLNRDFDKRLRASSRTLRSSPAPRSAAPPRTRAAGAGIELPAEVLTLIDTHLCDLLPSIPESDEQPTQRTTSGWACPECGARGVHVVLTNIMLGPDDALGSLHAYTWRKRALALDALICPRRWSDHLKSAAFPLLLNDDSISDLKTLCSSLRRQGLFDKAEINALRMLNARPTEAEPRLAYVNMLLDRLKLSRLLGKTQPHDHANDREACTKLASEVLQSVQALESEVGMEFLVASARLALESGDPAAAGLHLREARLHDASDEARDELDVCEQDLLYATSQSAPSHGPPT